MLRHVTRRHWAAMCAALMVACGGEDPAMKAVEEPLNDVEIYSWWVAPGEAGALDGIIDIYEDRHPGSRVENAAAVDAANSRATLAARLMEGGQPPPDLYQENARELPKFLAENPGKLTPLNDFYAEHKLQEVLVPELVGNVTVNGEIIAVPMGIHRANSLFYNKAIFAKHGLEPPTTREELLDVCEKLKNEKVVPFALSYQGWVQNLFFELLHESVLGTQRYREFLDGNPGADNAMLAETVTLYSLMLDNYVHPDAAKEGFGWAEAATLLINDEAAMYAHGDWAKGLYTERGWVSDVDFGVVGTPGATDLFMYDLDIWVLPKDAVNPDGARAFLAAAVSLEGQLAFDLIKGATSVRSDLPADKLDSIGQSVLKSFKDAKVRRMSPLPDMAPLYEQFVLDRNEAKFVAEILKVYEQYKQRLKTRRPQ
jgi:glucose/mannose transport system substrate-binding protein